MHKNMKDIVLHFDMYSHIIASQQAYTNLVQFH